VGVAGHRTSLLVAWAFVGVLTATAAIDALAPLAPPKLVGQEAARAAELHTSARWADGSRARLIEREAQMTSRVRATLGPVHAAFALAVLHQAPARVVQGRDGWLFLRSAIALDAADPDNAVERTAALTAAFARRVAAQGVRFVVLPVPRKATVAAEKFPPDLPLRADLEDRLFAALAQRGVEALDLRPTLAALPLDQRYFQLDTHWTIEARRAAAAALAEHLGRRASDPTTELVEVPERAPADTLRAAGIADDSPLRALFRERTHHAFEVRPRGAANGAVGVVTDRMPALAHFGSSFSGRFPELLAHYVDGEVFAATNGGGAFLEALGGLRQCYTFGAWPEVVTCEFPLLLGLRQAERASMTLEATQSFALSVLPLTPTFELALESAPVEGDTRFTLPAGRLITSGDGVALVRITRPSGAGIGLWRIDSDGVRAEVPWHAARAHVLLPILDSGERGAAVRVTAVTPDGRATSVRATLVTDLDLGAALNGVPASAEDVRRAGAVALVRFDGPSVTRHAGVVCELDLEGWSGPIELVARGSSGREVRWRAEARGVVTVVLDLSTLSGDTLRELALRSATAPECRVISARFAAQARAAPAR